MTGEKLSQVPAENIYQSTGIAASFLNALKDYCSPPSIKTYDFHPAFLECTDGISPDFRKELKERNPNGYLIGLGMGGILALLDGFEEEPRGIICFDLNPQVVIAGRIFLDILKESENPEDLFNKCNSITDENFSRRRSGEFAKDKNLLDGWADWNNRDYTPEKFLRNLNKIDRQYENWINIAAEIRKNYDRLKTLALEDKIAVGYADISRDGLSESLSTLPGFNELTNVIYISNAISLSKNEKDYGRLDALIRTSPSSFFVHTDRSHAIYSLTMRIAPSVSAILEELKAPWKDN